MWDKLVVISNKDISNIFDIQNAITHSLHVLDTSSRMYTNMDHSKIL